VRVGLVIYGSLDTLSGGYLYDRKLVTYLEGQGDQVHIVSLPWQNYPRHCLHNINRKYYSRLVSEPVDIWLQDELNHPSLFWMNYRLKRSIQAPILSVVHHLRSSEKHPRAALWIYRAIEKAYLRSVDGFVFNSRTTRDRVETLLGRQTCGMVATPGGDRLGIGLTISQIERRAVENGPLRLLFVGNLIRRKGLHTLLRGLASLIQENWILEVVGRTDVDPAYTAEIQRFIRTNGLDERVVLRGKISEDRLVETMCQAHVMAMISTYEGFGIVYLEGMAFGLPAIASTAGGAGEIIENGKTGWLVPPGDAIGMTEKIRGYSRDRGLLFAHSREALSRFAEFPTWDQSVEKIRACLHNFVGR
jgi:glycosyltransferase involved in cell wall biosynthesis